MNRDANNGLSRSDSGFEAVEHTADVAIRVWAPDPETFFVTAAMGLNAILEYDYVIEAPQSIPLSVTGLDLEELLVGWLSEILYLCESEAMRFSQIPECHISKTVAGFSLDAVVLGVQNAESTTVPAMAIKAVTYHGLDLRRPRGVTIDQVIVFDT